jgi:hypothetical protein
MSGIESLDLDEVRNRVRVGVSSSRVNTVRASLKSLLRRSDADTSALEVIEDSAVRPSFGPARVGFSSWGQLTTNADTVVGGLGIGSNLHSPWTCTLGFTADHPNWGIGFTTASHCGGGIWSQEGLIANQYWFGWVAGTERVDPGPWNCGFWHLCRGSDAAFFQRSYQRPMARGLIARPIAYGSTSVNPSDPYFIVVGSSNGYVGQQVYKIGYATGWSTGTVSGSCIDRNLTGLPGYVRTVKCANQSTNPDVGGDSGGPLFVSVGGPFVQLSGTTIGPTDIAPGTVWSTISQIHADFSYQLTVTRPAILGTPNVIGQIVGGHPSLNWTSIPGALQYHVFGSTGGAFTLQTYTTSSSFTDGSYSAIAVSTTPPPAPWIAYYIASQAYGEYSANSNIVYFQRPPAISVTIGSQFDVQPYDQCYWTASASGGTGSYSYQWKVNGQNVGTNSVQLLYANTGSSFTLSVTVSDGSSLPATEARGVSVSTANPSCQF